MTQLTDTRRLYETTFSRSETMAITGISNGKLHYLEKKGIIAGLVLSDTGFRPAKFYTFNHLVEIKTLLKLREKLSLQKLTEAKNYLESIGKTGTFSDKVFILAGEDFSLVEKTGLGDYAVSLAGKHKGQLSMLLVDMNELITEIKTDGNKVLDFKRRIPVQYLTA